MSVVTAPEELTLHQVRAITPRLIDLARSGDALALDLSGVCHIDTAGMQLLLAIRREAARACTPLALENPSPAVSELLSFYRLERMFASHIVSEPA